jgi:hypothetical protein
MAYISADEVKAIRDALKARFPKFKFGCRKGSGSLSVEVTVKQGPIDFIDNYNRTVGSRPGGFRGGSPAEKSLQVNQFWFQEHFDGTAKDTIAEILQIIKSAPDRKWYDRSDVQSDYFETAYYIHLNIGEWNSPYALVK